MDATPLELTFHHAAHLHAFGLPDERLARVAARRAFVEMKMCFMRAAEDIEGADGERLQQEVRHATEVIELWRLRNAVLNAVPHGHERADMHRHELMQQINFAFPENIGTAVMPL